MIQLKHSRPILLPILLLASVILAACQTDGTENNSVPGQQSTVVQGAEQVPATTTQALGLDTSCDTSTPYTALWFQCEAASFALLRKGFEESLSNTRLQQAVITQSAINTPVPFAQVLNNPDRISSLLSPSAYWGLTLVGDPFRYPNSNGPNGARFYNTEADVVPVLFHDHTCAKLDGTVWMPQNTPEGTKLPAVVINNGSLVGTQPLYYWAAQALVRAGYMVLTFDQRSQGRSDTLGARGEIGSNIDPSVYWLNLVDAIDFLHSSRSKNHPWQDLCAETASTNAFNPLHAFLDRERLGVAGHSFGAAGATFAQSFGAKGAKPWPGKISKENPIDVIVAWDALGHPDSPINANGGTFTLGLGNYAGPVYNLTATPYPAVIPRVPALDLPSDYGVFSAPYLLGKNPERYLTANRFWRDNGQPAMVVVPHASTHTQYSQGLLLPSSSWCASNSEEVCDSGWVIRMAEHYTVAWFDRWLKQQGEKGFDTADQRLLDNGNPLTGAANMSWHYRSARYFSDRSGKAHDCDNLRSDC
ncbi:hypothetical protein EV673_0642 [Limnobacter thiooxidans]|uniref:Uncharacterized protein n=1 Tax=Limnobacter thiooxidans TaxID=131080 RepID=A0AA86MER2_9BURK|nr:hypothetical protein [Limnobacter sp.]MCZ8015224.1 hypothetical protein [Limnobacter sp.]RZS42308.1 hypothetical protein EV673_0642 [Limnobacter thiooxidans]BET26260.1 hypothetical protein RGQ30_17610 [Limnobacter thiooxidans]